MLVKFPPDSTPTDPADNGQDFVLLLVLVDRHTFENVPGQDDVFDSDQSVDVDVGVNEGHTHQIIVL